MSTATDLLLIRAGISYRQLDYWVRRGWIEPRFWRRNGEQVESGIGYTRDFSDAESRVAIRMGRLVNAGVRPEKAAVAARSMVDRDEDWVRLDGGVTMTVELGAVESLNYAAEVESQVESQAEPQGPPLDWEKGISE